MAVGIFALATSTPAPDTLQARATRRTPFEAGDIWSALIETSRGRNEDEMNEFVTRQIDSQSVRLTD